jgi:hypothetical protein
MICNNCNEVILSKRVIICICGELYCGDCVNNFQKQLCPTCFTYLNLNQKYEDVSIRNKDWRSVYEISRRYRENHTSTKTAHC